MQSYAPALLELGSGPFIGFVEGAGELGSFVPDMRRNEKDRWRKQRWARARNDRVKKTLFRINGSGDKEHSFRVICTHTTIQTITVLGT